MRSNLVRFLAAAVLALPAAAQSSVTDVVRAASPGVVNITVHFDTPTSTTRIEQAASGVVLGSRGLVLTNLHLVDELVGPDADEYQLVVYTDFFRGYDAEVVAVDERLDLALLQLDVEREMRALPLADSEHPPGDRVIAISRQSPVQHLAIAGALTFPSGPVQLLGSLLRPEEVLLSDCRFHKQLDGAPLLDSRGRVLGVHNSSHIVEKFVKLGEEEEKVVDTSYDLIVSAAAIRAAFGDYLAEHAGTPAVPVEAPPTEEAATAIAAVASAVVGVWAGEADAHPELPDPADPQAQRISELQGSGVVVDPSGLVLTHARLFQGENKSATVRLADGRKLAATLLGRDGRDRTALLAVDLPAGESLAAATMADSDAAMQGEFAAVVGRPFAAGITMSVGVLSSLERDGLYQVASWVHPGHWGGALVDRNGRLVGVAVPQPEDSERADEESYLGFAAPITGVRADFAEAWSAHVGSDAVAGVTPYTDEEAAARRTAVVEVAERTRGSLINVIVKQAIPQAESGFDPFGGGQKQFRLLGQGSGVIIHPSGLALSNWHVVDAAMEKDGGQSEDHRVEVTLPDGREYVVNVLSTSRDDDLALLALQLKPGELLQPVELGDSDTLRMGQPVIAIGNPLGLANSVSAGIISGLDEDVMIQGRLRSYEGMATTDTAINPGNSGGALLDTKGRLVGINSAGTVGLGRAIPVNKAREVFSGKLLSTEKTRSVYLGMRVLEDEKGLLIDSIDEGGPAASAALEVGDRLLAFGGQEAATLVVFAQLRRRAAGGTPIEARVLRGSEERTVELTPVGFDAWHAFRQSGVEVTEVDYAQESELVQTAGILLQRAYVGDDEARPRTLMSGALRVTRVEPIDGGHPLDVRAGDLLLGITVHTATTTDRYERLERFENVAHLKARFDPLATKEGQTATCWILREGEVRTAEVFLRRPPR